VTTNGRVWVGGNFYMNNPTKAYTFGDGVSEGDSSSIIDMDQERHNLQWAAIVKTNCPTIGWQKVDAAGNPIAVGTNDTKASFRVYGSLDAATSATGTPLLTVTDNQNLVDQDQTQGVFKIQNLKKNATYYIKEVGAPTGYQRSENIYRIITGDDDAAHYAKIDKVYNAQGVEITSPANKNLSGESGIVNNPSGAAVEWGKRAEGDDESPTGLAGSEWELTQTSATPNQKWTITDNTAAVTGVQILRNGQVVTGSINLETNQQVELTAQVLPSDAVQDVEWSSSSSMVSVDKGVVTVLRNANDGEDSTVTITAASVSDPTKKATVTIVCTPITVNSVTIKPSGPISMKQGDTQKLSVTTDPAGLSASWESSNADVVSVSEDGTLTALKAGTAIITAKSGDKQDTVTVTVTQPVERTSTDVYVKWTDRGQAKLYYWNDTENNNPFPGTAMSKVNCGSDSWYKFTVPLTGNFQIIVTGNNDGDKYHANGNPGVTDIPIPGTESSYYINGWYADVKEGAPSGCSVSARSSAPVRTVQSNDETQAVAELSDEVALADGAATPSGPHDVNQAVGLFKVTDLADGTYTLQETVAPAGFFLNPTVYEFKISGGNVTWTTGKSPAMVNGFPWISDVPTEFGFAKLDGGYDNEHPTTNPLAGSTWELEEFDATAKQYKHHSDVVDCVAESADKCTGADTDHRGGQFKLEKLGIGKYRLHETAAPAGYELDEDSYYYFVHDTAPTEGSPVTWAKATKNHDDKGTPTEITTVQSVGNYVNFAYNFRKTGSVNWVKVEEGNTGKVLAGSEWKLERRDGDTWTAIDPTTITDCTDTCDANGDQDKETGRFEITKLQWGEYRLTETKAPDGYNLSDKTYTFTIDASHLTGIKIQVDGKDLSDGNLIENTPGVILPETGGPGVNMGLVYLGVVLVGIAMMGCGIALCKQA
ncbi:SpaA isopeptide-forming pilin-related protein, partial [Bifidobacterium cuniculi]